MKVSEIFEGLKSGTVELDQHGHTFFGNQDKYKKYLLERYESFVANANGANDGKWSNREGETVSEVNKSMRAFHQRYLDEEPDDGMLIGMGFLDGMDCSKCGEKYRFSFDGTNLVTNVIFDETIDNGPKKWKGDFVKEKERCSYEVPKPTTGTITITDKIVFSNFFREIEDCPEEFEYRPEYSLNSYRGRANRTKYKSEHNVAYGQMGNMGVGIYVNKTNDSIIVGPCYHPAEVAEHESDEAYEKAMKKPVFKGFKKIGTVSLAVWRWEATDSATIKSHEIKLEGDVVQKKVKPGVWEFTHFYDLERFNDSDEEESNIYATLKWVKR